VSEERRANYNTISSKQLRIATLIFAVVGGGPTVGYLATNNKVDSECNLEPCVTLKRKISRLETQIYDLKDDIRYMKLEKRLKEREPPPVH